MKTFLIILFVSFNAYCEYKVDVYKPDKLTGVLTNSGTFKTLQEANSWINKHISENNFGHPAIYESKCDTQMNCTQVLKEPAVLFEVVGPTDITAQVQAEKDKESAKKAATDRVKNFDVSKINNASIPQEIKDLLLDLVEKNK